MYRENRGALQAAPFGARTDRQAARGGRLAGVGRPDTGRAPDRPTPADPAALESKKSPFGARTHPVPGRKAAKHMSI